MCQRMGLPPISTIGLGLVPVSSLIRVPRPPARITAFKIRSFVDKGLARPANQRCTRVVPPFQLALDIDFLQPIGRDFYAVTKRGSTDPIGRPFEFGRIENDSWNIKGSWRKPINLR